MGNGKTGKHMLPACLCGLRRLQCDECKKWTRGEHGDRVCTWRCRCGHSHVYFIDQAEIVLGGNVTITALIRGVAAAVSRA